MAKAKGFQFKQFFVAHDQCAMKVNTDSIILGSWCEPVASQRILDIGTGSGLLALMLAQKTAATAAITAIEIDEAAYRQANDNVEASPWAERLQVIHGNLLAYRPAQPFDFIVTNPPYFAGATKNSAAYHQQSKERHTARQEDALDIDGLFGWSQTHLADDGKMAMVFPYAREAYLLENASNNGFYVHNKLLIHASPALPPYLGAYLFGRTENEQTVQSMTIRTQSGEYTDAYRKLCKDFYLKF